MKKVSRRRLWRQAAAGVVLAITGCSSIQGSDLQGNTKVYVASAYTLSGCQEKLDEEAGHTVTMTQHMDQPLMSALNLGIVPPYECRGIVP